MWLKICQGFTLPTQRLQCRLAPFLSRVHHHCRLPSRWPVWWGAKACLVVVGSLPTFPWVLELLKVLAMSAGPDRVWLDVLVLSANVSVYYAEVLVLSRPPGAPVDELGGATHTRTVTRSPGLSSRWCAPSRQPQFLQPPTSLIDFRRPIETFLTSLCHNRTLT